MVGLLELTNHQPPNIIGLRTAFARLIITEAVRFLIKMLGIWANIYVNLFFFHKIQDLCSLK